MLGLHDYLLSCIVNREKKNIEGIGKKRIRPRQLPINGIVIRENLFKISWPRNETYSYPLERVYVVIPFKKFRIMMGLMSIER